MHLAPTSGRLRAAPVLIVALVLGSVLPSRADGTWSTFPPPPPRANAGAGYDPLRHHMLMFGPLDTQLWRLSLDGTPAWDAPFATGAQPPASASIVVDPLNDRLIAFDGATTGHVWTLPLAGPLAWSTLAVGGPAPPVGPSAVYDPVRKRVVTFGGELGGVVTASVYALALTGSPAWSVVTTSGTPPAARKEGSLIYDSTRDRVVLYGGYDPGLAAASEHLELEALLSTRYGDVWALTLGATPTWSLIPPQGALIPAARTGQSAVYDPVFDRMIMYGGSGAGVDGGVWAFSLGATPQWTGIGGGGPGARYGHVAVYDPTHQSMLAFGGSSSTVIVDDATYAFDLAGGGGWSVFEGPDRLPSARSGAAAAFDAARRQMVVYGRTGTGSSDTWWLSLSPGISWGVPVGLSGNPPARSGATMVYDAVGDAMFLFGGVSVSAYLAETWRLQLGAAPAWTLFPTSAPPTARSSHTAIMDPLTRRVIVFGGGDASGPRNDVWTLSIATGVWTQLAPTGVPPSARTDMTAIYDGARRRMVVFGGADQVTFPFERNDVWALSLDGAPAWTQLTPAGPPPAGRDRHSAVLDPVRDRMVVFGGEQPDYSNELWALTFTPALAWTPLATAGVHPHARSGQVAVFDDAGQRMVMFGGYAPGNLQDAWLLSWNPAVAVPQTDRGGLIVGSPSPNPTRAGARIAFSLVQPSPVRIEVFDIGGRAVRRLIDRTLDPGEHSAAWDGADESGHQSPAGLYLYRIQVGETVASRRLVLIR